MDVKRTCSCCRAVLPLIDFPRNRRETLGYAYRCKSCSREAVRRSKAKRSVPYDRSDSRYDSRAYDALPHRRAALAARRTAYRANNKVRISATKKLRRAVYLGRIVRLPCLVCGKTPSEGHHADYERPLDVMWLCASHHRQAHAASKPY